MSLLDERFRVTKPDPALPTLHYGIPFTADNIWYCVRQRQLLTQMESGSNDDTTVEGHTMSAAIMAVKRYLQRTLRVRIFVEIPFGTYNLGMFALYTNHTRLRHRRLNKEKAVLVSMRQELNIDQNQTAKWYWDIDHGLSYECNFPEFNI
ncbi:hypothetical protein PENSPDRAFT_684911 [Peniophora sp. CONT]|nr:hypothetical protein PENSPDRAFT_684911 [Peniophora sp. CONT]